MHWIYAFIYFQRKIDRVEGEKELQLENIRLLNFILSTPKDYWYSKAYKKQLKCILLKSQVGVHSRYTTRTAQDAPEQQGLQKQGHVEESVDELLDPFE